MNANFKKWEHLIYAAALGTCSHNIQQIAFREVYGEKLNLLGDTFEQHSLMIDEKHKECVADKDNYVPYMNHIEGAPDYGPFTMYIKALVLNWKERIK